MSAFPEPFPHRVYPCDECPWKLDAEPGRFCAERYEALAVTSGNGVPIDAPMFGCHKGEPGTNADLACAGWLAVAGREHPAVRLAVSLGRLPMSALEAGANWPDLYESYADLARANGVTGDGMTLTDAGHRALPAGCACGYVQSHADGHWRLISRRNCPMHSESEAGNE